MPEPIDWVEMTFDPKLRIDPHYMIRVMRGEVATLTKDRWEDFYDKKIGLDKIEDAADKNWEYIQRIKENLNMLDKKDVFKWTHDLIMNKTFSGLQLQLEILEMVSYNEYRLATPEEESKGIDGFVDGEPVSIKPNTYKKKIEYGKEAIPYRIIYYKQTKKGLVIA